MTEKHLWILVISMLVSAFFASTLSLGWISAIITLVIAVCYAFFEKSRKPETSAKDMSFYVYIALAGTMAMNVLVN